MAEPLLTDRFWTKSFLSFVESIGQSSTTNVSYLACGECFGATDVSRPDVRCAIVMNGLPTNS